MPIGSEKLIYLPYLMGERSPHPDPDCRGVFFGLSAMHERPHLIRSVMEGISFSQWECVEVFREMGVPIEDMMICGGGGRSPFWRQMLADMYGCSVSTVQSDQGGALGAAQAFIPIWRRPVMRWCEKKIVPSRIWRRMVRMRNTSRCIRSFTEPCSKALRI